VSLKPLSAAQALDAHYLEARARLLDLAAILDRIDRGGPVDDPRYDRLRAGLNLLLESKPTRAELVQELFSLPYDPSWKRPEPR
jgi:hypothetical protein